jgi:predicted O-methyltransferase YrrM
LNVRQSGKRLLGSVFVGLQRAGVDVLPRHFYSSIPDVRRLRAEQRWRGPRSLVGVQGTNIDDQLEFLRSFITPDVSSQLRSRDIYADACAENGAIGYGPVEADCLYGFVRSMRPQKIVQVGAGVSTSVILAAAREAGYSPEIAAVDPYPTVFLNRAPVTLIDRDAQDVAPEELAALAEGDLLFIDSTHTVRVDGEVNMLVLEVLPRLKPGVWIHFHDIYLPYDYQRDILNPPLFFWTESTLVHAFLIGNRGVRIAASLSMLHYQAPLELQKLIPRYRPEPNVDGLRTTRPNGHFPSSLYLRTVNAQG